MKLADELEAAARYIPRLSDELEDRILARALGQTLCAYPAWIEQRMQQHKKHCADLCRGQILSRTEAQTSVMKKLIDRWMQIDIAAREARVR